MHKKIKMIEKETKKVEKGLSGLLKTDKKMDAKIDKCDNMKKKMKKKKV